MRLRAELMYEEVRNFCGERFAVEEAALAQTAREHLAIHRVIFNEEEASARGG